jgi:phage recombination protein Bet
MAGEAVEAQHEAGLQTRRSSALAPVSFDNQRVELLKNQLMRPKNRPVHDVELDLFMATCRRTGLDPFQRQIYAVFRWDNRSRQEEMSIQVSIDGFRLIAQRTGEFDGYPLSATFVNEEGMTESRSTARWCGSDGVWTDVWLSENPPAAAKVSVARRGAAHPATCIATWSQYCQRDRDGNPTGMWLRMGATMLAKCAEALALRMMFPNDLSGLYTTDEMGQANNGEEVEVQVAPPRPDPEKPRRSRSAEVAAKAGDRAGDTFGEARAGRFMLHLQDLDVALEGVIEVLESQGLDVPPDVADWPYDWRENIAAIAAEISAGSSRGHDEAQDPPHGSAGEEPDPGVEDAVDVSEADQAEMPA